MEKRSDRRVEAITRPLTIIWVRDEYKEIWSLEKTWEDSWLNSTNQGMGRLEKL